VFKVGADNKTHVNKVQDLYRAVILLAVCLTSVQAQEKPRSTCFSARPIDGWDSLVARIKYTEIFLRAGAHGSVGVGFRVDTSGTIDGPIYVKTTEHYLVDLVRDAVRATRWQPAMKMGEREVSIVSFRVDFTLLPDTVQIRSYTGKDTVLCRDVRSKIHIEIRQY